MDKSFNTLDWSFVQAFLSVAETGSLSAAARTLNASQPTLGRQIKMIEERLGVALFVRHPRGLAVSDIGQTMLAPARAMRDAMNQIALSAAGQQETLKGTVRITVSEVMSQIHLPAILSHIRQKEPEFELELVPSDATENLLYREADIAIRMYRPTQLDLITQHLGDLEIGVFAAKSYWERRAQPTKIENFADHDFVGYDRNEVIIQGMRQAGIDVDRHFFGTRCDDNAAYWELVRAGCGIGFSQVSVGERDPLVERLNLDVPIGALPVWLTAHEVMRSTPRIRRVWHMLHEGLKPLFS